jgi:CII-binding regulator of phage lambda lysogenization HflD
MENYNRKSRKKYSGLFFERALPNEYLVPVGKKNVKPVLGGKKFRWFRKYIHVPAFVQRLKFSTDNANVHYQGIEIQGYASWRINPENPEKSIATLDFFDDNDPMLKTNEELKTICIEAVRHTIANMTIDDALKKKDDIAESLLVQLKTIENKWGIIFDQVGIEQVRVMSAKLFNDLQSEFRSKLHLNASISQLQTDSEIARLNNETHEKNTTEKLETEQKLGMIKVQNSTKLKQKELLEEMNLNEQKRKYKEEAFRNEITFKMEQEEKEHEFEILKNNLKISLNKLETQMLETSKDLEVVKSEISRKHLEIRELEKKLEQSYSNEQLKMDFIQMLPQLFEAIRIDNYAVLDTGSNSSTSPVLKIIQELFFALKNTGIDFFGKPHVEQIKDEKSTKK